MAAFSTSDHCIALTFFILFFKTLAADPVSSFSFSEFQKDPKFKSNFSLYGDANVVNGGHAVQLSGSVSSAAGRVMYKKPIKLVEGLSTRKIISVKFSTLRDPKNGDFVKNNVAINLGNLSAKVRNTSSVNMSQSSGGKSYAWIDYEAGSKRLEVRLSEYGDLRPSEPVLWLEIDFSKMWEKEEMFVGLSPFKGNASQICYVYSLEPYGKPRTDCLLRVLAAMIFGAGCGAVTASFVLYFWTIFGNRQPVVPEQYVMQPVDFEYKKVNVVVEKTIEDGKK
ncbi:L-type lectin-domain containing receptor kinase VIII.2 [Quillaja saponaria]|uniref:L-type lectin-domain containing receptor kinase VIII.2 n=1 Tax=Quillaja saponaria TaxID=32244 RepID=A0AAD7PC90_QUISA|nr:L-type lectin-domain containing receptor kinase VIII.2 [Quillaja saponaria]